MSFELRFKIGPYISGRYIYHTVWQITNRTSTEKSIYSNWMLGWSSDEDHLVTSEAPKFKASLSHLTRPHLKQWKKQQMKYGVALCNMEEKTYQYWHWILASDPRRPIKWSFTPENSSNKPQTLNMQSSKTFNL